MIEVDSFLRQFGSGKGGKRKVLVVATRQWARKVQGCGDGKAGPPQANAASFTTQLIAQGANRC